MHPGKETKFEESFPSHIPAIKDLYRRTVTTPDQRLLKGSNDGKENTCA